MKSYKFSSGDQAFGALVRAPLVPVSLLFVIDAILRAIQFGPLAIFGAAIMAIYILIVMEFFSLVVGGVILALIWKRVSFSVLLTSSLGGLIAILPALALTLPDPVVGLNASLNGIPTVIDGQKTSYGYWRDVETLAIVFAFGLIGGASFWWFGKPKADNSGSVTNDR